MKRIQQYWMSELLPKWIPTYFVSRGLFMMMILVIDVYVS